MQIGDRVIVTDESMTEIGLFHQKGKVISERASFNGSKMTYCVEFDEWRKGHTEGGASKSQSCWWVPESSIEVISEVPLHREICEELTDLYKRKNADYGDAFHQSYLEEGMAMVRIRLGDKYLRFKNLSKEVNPLVKDESIRDTLLDLANYAILAIMELDKEGKT